MSRHRSLPTIEPVPPMPGPVTLTTAPVPVTLDPGAVLDPSRTAPAEVIERLRRTEGVADNLHAPVAVQPHNVQAGDHVRICITAVVTEVNHDRDHTSYRYVPTDEWPNGAYSLELPDRAPEDLTITVEVL